VLSVSKALSNTAKKVAFNPNRREFAVLGAVAAFCSGSASATSLTDTTKSASPVSLTVNRQGNLFRPESGEHPGLVMFAAPAASHSANAAVAQQLASQGWAVLLVENHGTDDPARISRDAHAHADWLVAQPGVAAVSPEGNDAKHGFTLRSFSAVQPKLSLANREQRQAASASAVLFAAPTDMLAKRAESLNAAARALHRFSA
jgi:hypothetical protein